MDSYRSLTGIADALEPTKQLTREEFTQDQLIVSREIRDAIIELIGILESKDFDEALRHGVVTLGLVKPNIAQWCRQDLSIYNGLESNALKVVLESVRSRVNLTCGVNSTIIGKAFAHFRAANKTSLRSKKSGLGYPSLWEEERALLASGASTALIIWGDQIVDVWRSTIGNTYPSNADPGTLRREFGYSPQNNLFHGADPKDYGDRYKTVRHEYNCFLMSLKATLVQIHRSSSIVLGHEKAGAISEELFWKP